MPKKVSKKDLIRTPVVKMKDESENAGELKKLEELVQESPGFVDGYNRMMVLYRKEKRYKEELSLIERAIAAVIKETDQQQKDRLKGRKNKRELETLSAAFMQKSGLQDKKGRPLNYPEPIPTWLKRKETVLKRLSKKK